MLKYDVEERIDPEELAVAVFLNSAQEKVRSGKSQYKVKIGRAMHSRIQGHRGNRNSSRRMGNCPISSISLCLASILNRDHLNRDHLNKVVFKEELLLFRGLLLQVLTLWRYPCQITTTRTLVPNNQSLLSANSLHNKLRIIEKINEEDEESEGMPSQLSSTVPSHLTTPNIINTQNTLNEPPSPSSPPHPGQRIVVQQNQEPPKNANIQLLHQQIQKSRHQPPTLPPNSNLPQHQPMPQQMHHPIPQSQSQPHPHHHPQYPSAELSAAVFAHLRCKVSHRACLPFPNECSQCQCLLSTCHHLKVSCSILLLLLVILVLLLVPAGVHKPMSPPLSPPLPPSSFPS